MNKTPEQIAVQKAIVCLYLRKRRARRYLISAKAKMIGVSVSQWDDVCREIEDKIICENEAHNALESIKRVLWHDYWS